MMAEATTAGVITTALMTTATVIAAMAIVAMWHTGSKTAAILATSLELAAETANASIR